mgnify:CR=1 FL=1
MSPWKLLSEGGALVQSARDFGMVIVFPSLLPFLAFNIATSLFPIWGRAVVAFVLFSILLYWAWFIGGERMNTIIRAHHESRTLVWFPLAVSLGMLLFAMYVFAAISAVSVSLGFAVITPVLPQESWSRMTDLYLWHFVASVPGFKIPETLLWEAPFQYKDHLSGALLLLFQFIVIAPVIKVFVTWNRVRIELRSKQ